MVSLGCPKNTVDSERVLGDLAASGYDFTPDEEDAEIIIVNTCGFIESAKKESVEAILEMAHKKIDGKCEKLIVPDVWRNVIHKNYWKKFLKLIICLGSDSIRN